MTEYDYSPAAYERYVAQQTRVSNWVSDTLQQSHAYANPFVLSPTRRDRSFYDEPNPPPHHHRYNAYDSWSSASSRPSRSRSKSYVDNTYHDRVLPQRYRSQSQSRSPPTPRDVQAFYPSHASQPYLYPQPHVPRAPASRVHTAPPPHSYQYPSPYVTQPPPGQIYHYSPNAPVPTSKNTHHRHASHSHHPTSKPPSQPYLLVQRGGPKAEYKRGPPIHAPIPTKPHAQQQPLLKRLLGFVTMSPVGGRSGNGRGFRGSSY